MYHREVRSGNSRRKARNKGGTTTRRPSLTLLDPLLVNFRARVSHHHSPCRAAVLRTCRLQGGNGVDVQGDSTGVYPAHCRDQRTRVTSGKRNGQTPPGLPSCRTWSARCHVAHRGAPLMLRFGGGDRERSSTRRWQFRDSSPRYRSPPESTGDGRAIGLLFPPVELPGRGETEVPMDVWMFRPGAWRLCAASPSSCAWPAFFVQFA